MTTTDAQQPAEFTVGERTFELVPFLKEGAHSVTTGESMAERARELNANLGEEEGRFILGYQDKIPAEWQKVYLVFTNWRHPSHPQTVAFLYWNGYGWCQEWSWTWLASLWPMHARLVRRKR